jgi:hypothetical protein
MRNEPSNDLNHDVLAEAVRETLRAPATRNPHRNSEEPRCTTPGLVPRSRPATFDQPVITN